MKKNAAAFAGFAALVTAMVFSFCAQSRAAAGTPYTPSSGAFSCVLPPGWIPMEEAGGLIHILGPQSPNGDYRAGIDIQLMRAGDPGFVSYKDELKRLREGFGGGDEVDAAPVKGLKVSGALARFFESNESRFLPDDRLPASRVALHHFTAFIPSRNDYYLIDLSCTRQTYLDYRGLFMEFLGTFRIGS
ncbi:MAG: hypothetical protein ACYCPQ_05920 [Elusimicrobiota bacterium]